MNIKPLDYDSSEEKRSSVRINVDSWKIRTYLKNGDRMKLKIDLDKDESLAFANFKKVIKPDEVSDDKFIKAVFLTGVQKMNDDLQEILKKYVAENRDELASSGITVVEGDDGSISLSDSDTETVSDD